LNPPCAVQTLLGPTHAGLDHEPDQRLFHPAALGMPTRFCCKVAAFALISVFESACRTALTCSSTAVAEVAPSSRCHATLQALR
jgi:hypothetical protein